MTKPASKQAEAEDHHQPRCRLGDSGRGIRRGYAAAATATAAAAAAAAAGAADGTTTTAAAAGGEYGSGDRNGQECCRTKATASTNYRRSCGEDWGASSD
ncbi:MAG TPA: hypothetical protein VGB55_06475 [Tepidisphaeraceae bacterium]